MHEFRREFKGQLCDFRVTAVLGHVLTIDFPSKFQSWDLDPGVLFDAPVQKKEASPGARVVEHLEREAKGAAHLILWLDCDREGENICFEVMDACVPVMRPPPAPPATRTSIAPSSAQSPSAASRTPCVPSANPTATRPSPSTRAQEARPQDRRRFHAFPNAVFSGKVRRLRQQRRLLRSVPDAHSRIAVARHRDRRARLRGLLDPGGGVDGTRASTHE